MGLDMYLERQHYIGAQYVHREVTGSVEIKIGDKPVKIDINKVTEIREHVAYWRKTNQIHAWFVRNVQNNVDDCKEYDVSHEDLMRLVQDCKNVLRNPELANDILPPQDGFFFGSTGIDQYYFEDLKNTIEQLKDLPEGDYLYRASW